MYKWHASIVVHVLSDSFTLYHVLRIKIIIEIVINKQLLLFGLSINHFLLPTNKGNNIEY